MKDEKIPAKQMAGYGIHNYENVFLAGLRLQQEAWRHFSSMSDPATFALETHKRSEVVSAIVDRWMRFSQESIKNAWEFARQNAQTSADLVKKAANASQSAGVTEGEYLWCDFLKSSLQMTRSNADALMQINSNAIDLWMDLIQQIVKTPPASWEMGAKASRSKA